MVNAGVCIFCFGVMALMLIISGSIYGSMPERRKGVCNVLNSTITSDICCHKSCGGCSNCGNQPKCSSLSDKKISGSCCSDNTCCAQETCTTNSNGHRTCRCSFYVTQSCNVNCNPCEIYHLRIDIFDLNGKHLGTTNENRQCYESDTKCINENDTKFATGEDVTCYYIIEKPTKDVKFNDNSLEVRHSWMIAMTIFGTFCGVIVVVLFSMFLTEKYKIINIYKIFSKDRAMTEFN